MEFPRATDPGSERSWITVEERSWTASQYPPVCQDGAVGEVAKGVWIRSVWLASPRLCGHSFFLLEGGKRSSGSLHQLQTLGLYAKMRNLGGPHQVWDSGTPAAREAAEIKASSLEIPD